jgi:glycosyltransferase involved in cell wall biosynthesis
MKISLITVCFNSSSVIRTALESVLRQQGVELDYIVVDGGSTDGTVDILKEYELQFASRMRMVSECDEGMYDAINKGIRMAKGDVVGILNADDRLEDENTLAAVAAAFEPGIDCIYGDIRFVRGESLKTTRYYSSRRWRPWMHNWGFMPAHPSVYVRREIFERVGNYKLGYDISADFEWMVRLLCRARVKTRYLPRSIVTMRLGGKSTAGLRAMLRLNRENVRANRENGYFCVLPMMLPKYFFKIWGYVFRRQSS